MAIDTGKVGMIQIDKIIVKDRARQDLGNLEELESNMKSSGLISPLAVKDNGDGTYQLLAGERRYTILLSNGTKEVPARIYNRDLSELEMKIIEKSENFYRKDFEYWELDALIAEIHKLQQKVHGTSAPGPGGSGHTLKDTGEMFGLTNASVSTAIKRAEAREAFPDLFKKCKTAKDATKVIKKMDEAVIKQTIAEKLEREKSDGTTLKKLANSYIIKDFFEGVKTIPDGVIHLVEIDPPYAIDLTKVKKSDGESQYQEYNYNEINKKDYIPFINKLLSETYRVMADNSWLIFWYGPEPWAESIYNAITSAGFTTTHLHGVWTKPTGQNHHPHLSLSSSYESFYYARKGKPTLNKPGRSNVFTTPPVPPQQKTHPTERPVELMKELYETFTFPGSRILIPFLGSGNGLIAAYQLGMSAMGFELSKSYRDSFLVKVNSIS